MTEQATVVPILHDNYPPGLQREAWHRQLLEYDHIA